MYAEIVGYGATDDAHHMTAPDPEGNGGARAIRMAYEEAGADLANEKIYINAHGTSTPLNERSETLAIKKAFGEHAYDVVISSTKSMTGHMLGAAGAVEAIASVLLGESRENVADLIHFSKTTGAYNALMAGEADLLVVAEAGEATYAQRDEQGLEWSQEPIATEALVFMVNADNPVDSLTVEEIQKIYTGEITNWSQVGGEDREIVPFQRNKGGGSQAIMEKEVMGDLEMMQPANTEYFIGTMEGLIEAVRSFDGSPAAIGYTVYYYAHDMKMADGLKIIAVDSIQPNAETIRSRAYPFINDSYVVIPAGLADDAPAKVLYDWLMSAEGQKLVALEGYVSTMDVGDTP